MIYKAQRLWQAAYDTTHVSRRVSFTASLAFPRKTVLSHRFAFALPRT
jgi:hypothetical protein